MVISQTNKDLTVETVRDGRSQLARFPLIDPSSLRRSARAAAAPASGSSTLERRRAVDVNAAERERHGGHNVREANVERRWERNDRRDRRDRGTRL